MRTSNIVGCCLSLAVALGAVVAGVNAAAAGDAATAPKSKLGPACKVDLKTLCKDVQPGGGRMIACLRQNNDKLSPDCAAAVAALPTKKAK
jgi:hypothetical protein